MLMMANPQKTPSLIAVFFIQVLCWTDQVHYATSTGEPAHMMYTMDVSSVSVSTYSMVGYNALRFNTTQCSTNTLKVKLRSNGVAQATVVLQRGNTPPRCGIKVGSEQIILEDVSYLNPCKDPSSFWLSWKDKVRFGYGTRIGANVLAETVLPVSQLPDEVHLESNLTAAMQHTVVIYRPVILPEPEIYLDASSCSMTTANAATEYRLLEKNIYPTSLLDKKPDTCMTMLPPGVSSTTVRINVEHQRLNFVEVATETPLEASCAPMQLMVSVQSSCSNDGGECKENQICSHKGPRRSTDANGIVKVNCIAHCTCLNSVCQYVSMTTDVDITLCEVTISHHIN